MCVSLEYNELKRVKCNIVDFAFYKTEKMDN